MLMRRHYVDNMAEGATPKEVAPKPTHETKPEVKEVNVKEDMPEEKKLTRSDIMKMNVAQVRAYAESQGIEEASAMSGAELKRILGNKLFEESENE